MIDVILLGIIGLSALLGLMRGLLATVLGITTWLIAGWAAVQFGEPAAQLLSNRPGAGDYVGGFLMVFIGTWLGMLLLRLMLRSLVDSTQFLRVPDRMLGLCLGAARGLLFAVLAVFLLGFTSLPRKPAWQQSSVVPMLQPMAGWMRAQLPEPPDLPSLPSLPSIQSVPMMDLGKSVLTGDNGGPNEQDQGSGLPAALLGLKGQAQRANDSSPADPAGALPANIDPAQVRPGQPDPKRVEAQGQARPPSR